MGATESSPAGYAVAALVGAISYRALAVSNAKRLKTASSAGARDQDMVRAAYHQTITDGGTQGCCQVVQGVAGSRIGYSASDLQMAGAQDDTTMLGCGTPVEVAKLTKGETVLDLGCGAGIDCFIAARRVGETGTVIGVDIDAHGGAEPRGKTKIKRR